MKKKTTIAFISALFVPFATTACDPTAGGSIDEEITDSARVKSEPGKADSSAEAVFLSFAFDAEIIVSSTWGLTNRIEDRMLYSVGQLNGERSVSRLDRLDVSNIKKTKMDDGKWLVSYHAEIPVAWGKKSSVPSSYTLRLPRDVSWSAQSDFTEKYKDSCVDWSAHDVDSGSMWYYYRPNAWNCKLDAEDVFDAVATVTPSSLQTTGKFPEYDKVWEDDTLKVVSVFGKYEDGATSGSDAGIAAYNEFVRKTKSLLSAYNMTSTPASIPSYPGVDTPDIEMRATLPDGKKIEVVMLLVDNVRTAGYTFNARYAQLSSHADLIAYNGHSGLGANIRALAGKGKWVSGQYAIVFMNGCDTYAYVDSALYDAHAKVNSDDSIGTKYVDVVMNAMPAYFRSDAEATLALVNGLLDYEAPRTYEQIFKDIDSSQVVLVSGEEDNTFVPGGGGGGGQPWDGMDEEGTVARNQEARFETPTLEPGKYVFELDGNHDADLYVRIGTAPTKYLYDCRPYRYGSRETCTVEITTPAPVHVMVRGWASSSDFTLAGFAQ